MCGLSFICPGTCAPGSICLPCIPMPCGIHGRAALNGYYTWHFSMQGLPANDVTVISRGLLPHVFNLALRSFSEGGLALWQFSLKACLLAISLSDYPHPQKLHQAVIFCGTLSLSFNRPAVHRCIALCCPDFPHLPYRRSDSLACSKYKGRNVNQY